MSRTPRLSRKFSKPTLSRQINGDISTPNQPTEPTKTRLDHYLVEKYPNLNRSTLQKLIKDGSVSVDGETITKPSTLVSGDESIIVRGMRALASSDFGQSAFPGDFREKNLADSKFFSENPEKNVRPGGQNRKKQDSPRTIYEDANVLVLDKPPGMLSMSKGQYNPEPTLEGYGLIAHRLDRGTSGVIILAKNEPTKAHLQKQFEKRKVKKTYYAVVSGHPTPSQAIIDIPLTRNLSRPSTFQPDPNGREAITEYEVVDQNADYSLVKLKPTTGRTHQLRVHLNHLGTPILGDTVYGRQNLQTFATRAAVEEGLLAPTSSRTAATATREDGLARERTPDGKRSEVLPGEESRDEKTRLYLHAAQLEITLPGGIRKTFTSPIPQEFSDVLRRS